MTCFENLGQSLLLQFPLEPGSFCFVLFFFSSLQEENSIGNQFHDYFHRPRDLARYGNLYTLSTLEYGQWHRILKDL